MRLRRLTAALVLAGLVATTGPGAVAAESDSDLACPAEGARVVVDFGDLVDGGPEASLRTACDDEVDGERADKTIADSGFALTYATRDQGFVCRVDGVPSEDPCVNAAPADAYWSVWWAPAGGEWTYSSRGVGTLRTPAGGSVALVWHSGDGEAAAPALSPSEADDVALGPADGVDAAASDADSGSGSTDGLPTWLAPAVLVLLLAAAGGVALVRRRDS